MDADFAGALARGLRQVPRGRVATCGTIARALGDLRAARSVAAWILEHPETPAAHRVVTADGRPLLAEAMARLAKEDVRFVRGRVPPDRFMTRLQSVGLLTALREQQIRLAGRVIERDDGGPIGRIAGADVAYQGDRMYAVAVSLDRESLEPLEIAAIRRPVEFPYVPTYLAYREFAGIEAAVNRLSHRPDILFVDGHGRLHPALFGVACLAGVRLNLPTIVIAKHPLVGRVKSKSATEADAFPIQYNGRTRGYAWLPPGRSRPIFISVGNRISLENALHVVQQATRRAYPEPLKLADRISKEMKRNEKREKGAKQ